MKIGKIKIDIYVLGLVVLILLSIVAIAGITSKVLVIADKSGEIRYEIETEYLKRERFNQLLATYAEIEEEGIREKLGEIIPSHENFLDVVKELEDIATLSGTTIIMRLGEAKLTSEGVEVGTSTGGAGRTTPSASSVQAGGINFDLIEIEATVRGKYDNLIQFLNLFNQARYFMNINQLVVNKVQTDTAALIDTRLTISVFVDKIIRTQ